MKENPRGIYDWFDCVINAGLTLSLKKMFVRILQQAAARGLKIKNAKKIAIKYDLLWPL